MANKGNASIRASKEMVVRYGELIRTYNSAITTSIDSIRPLINYLSSEEEIGGTRTENYKEALNGANQLVSDTMQKLSNLSAAIDKIQELLGVTITAKSNKLSDAQQDLAKLVSDVKSVA